MKKSKSTFVTRVNLHLASRASNTYLAALLSSYFEFRVLIWKSNRDTGRTPAGKNPEITPRSKLVLSNPLQQSAGLPKGSTARRERTDNARLNPARLIARAEIEIRLFEITQRAKCINI